MAEFVVSTVATKLSEMVTQELTLLHGVSDEVEWMERELRWIKCFLKDADAKGKRDERVKNWVNDVTDLAYRAETAIDTFLIKVRQSRGGPSCINSFKPKAWVARHHVGLEISKIKKRLNEIKAARETYGIQNLSEDHVHERSEDGLGRRRHFPPNSHDADIVGLVNDQKILLERLMNHDHGQQQGSCVISIIGIGGLGKTTLARKLYRSNAVSNHFHVCIWLTVSQENSLMEVLRKMLIQVPGIKEEYLKNKEEHDLIDMLNDSLRTRRFLIVLDDIWGEDVCIQMQEIFRNVNNESRVLITTRFFNVAKRADPRSTPYRLQLLNDDESMKLLLKKVFPYEDADGENCISELLDVGRSLMLKCGGLPLALVVLGGLLSIKDKTPVVWRRVLETMDWEAEGRACQEILALSYEDLPHNMKLCFLYFSAYPEDCEIYASELIRKWIAEGFIRQEGRKTLEDIAEAILEELIQRSLIHVNTRKSNGTVKTCVVHDLLLDFARSVAEKDRFLTVCFTENDQPISSPLSHRVAIHINNIHTLTNEINTRHDGLRTLMAFALDKSALYDHPIVSAMFKFQFLRVLDLIRAGSLSRLPKEIKLMIHLRYLRLCGIASFGKLSSIGDLQLLETIQIKYVVHDIPITLWKIKTLRHVQLRCCTPPQSLKLEDLLTLDSVTFGSHETISWRFPNLRKLKVYTYDKHHGAMLTHLLSELGHLISLHIYTVDKCLIEINTKDFPFHNRLLSLTLGGSWPKGDTISEFPIYLTKLELHDSELKENPMPKLERLQYLVTLKLFGKVYLGKTMVCSTGGFPKLETLFSSNGLHNLEEWRVERGAMPKLTVLKLGPCEKFTMLPDFQHVTSLQELWLYDMSEELMRRSEMETGEDWYKIQHVPKLYIGKW